MRHACGSDRSRRRAGGCAVLLSGAFCLPLLAAAQQLTANPGLKPTAPTDPHRPLAQELVASASPSLSITLVGSLLLDSPTAAPAAFAAAVRARLAPGAQNVTIGTLEGPLIDVPAVIAYPYPWHGAPAVRAARSTAAVLQRAGFTGLMLATGHALDWGIAGMQSTEAALDASGIAYAGTGGSLGLAAHAGYIDQSGGGGRIALVSATTSFRSTSNALAAHGEAPARPGVSGIDLSPIRLVSPAQRDELQRVGCRFEYPSDPDRCVGIRPARTVTALGSTFMAVADAARWGTSTYDLDVRQADVVLGNIREGKQNSDFLIAAISAGQVGDRRTASPPVPEFLRLLLHAEIEAGADVAFATGQAQLGPIELYRTARRPGVFPIFYGLGNFAWTQGLAPPAGLPSRFDGAIVRLTIQGGHGLIDIFPLDLSTGWPRLAGRARGAAIIERLRALSQPYGTRIGIVAHGSAVIGRITYSLAARGKSP
jgi:poly-gamma-glutamate capsule biosynthesis protein CapA/YwtB (metallophosphatase superfamily)